MKIYDTVIIGGGPAGYTAAMYAARAGLSALVIEKMSIGGQMTLTDAIDNYPGFEDGIDGISLGMKMQAGAEKWGAQTLFGEVLSVDFTEKIKRIQTDSEQLSAKTVIIATGANPRELGVKGEESLIGRGIHYCAHCDGRFYKDKEVAVIGGGNSAVADAIYLSRLAKRVYIVHRRDKLRASFIYNKQLFETKNIEILYNCTVMGIEEQGEKRILSLNNIGKNQIESLAVDGVFVSIGRVPSTDIFKGIINLDENGYIIAGEDLKTNIEGVFAAGDVRTKSLRQIVTAAADGAIAAEEAEKYLSKM